MEKETKGIYVVPKIDLTTVGVEQGIALSEAPNNVNLGTTNSYSSDDTNNSSTELL